MPEPPGTHLDAHTAHSTFAPAPGTEELRARLAALVATPGARFAILVDPEGYLIEVSGNPPTAAELAGGLAIALVGTAGGAGRELGVGRLRGAVLEYDTGALVLQRLATGEALAVGIDHPAVLPTLRSRINAALPELEGALR